MIELPPTDGLPVIGECAGQYVDRNIEGDPVERGLIEFRRHRRLGHNLGDMRAAREGPFADGEKGGRQDKFLYATTVLESIIMNGGDTIDGGVVIVGILRPIGGDSLRDGQLAMGFGEAFPRRLLGDARVGHLNSGAVLTPRGGDEEIERVPTHLLREVKILGKRR